jgi:CheY-like chemotaxis protein
MPKVSGRELLEKIKSDNTLNKTKTVFLTVATFSESGQQELKKLGNTDYIQKPFENENFIKRIKKALAEK